MNGFKEVSLQHIPAIAAQLFELAHQKKIWAFYGDLGAGKTTLIKAICEACGVTTEVSSPTFSLVNQYQTKLENPVFHFDFYRIKNLEEAYDIGYEEYFDSGNLCLIEWPEKIEPLLAKEDVLYISLTKTNESTRDIEVW
jgi:tRNA threonylcarbamoyladenosine biosynthesis protein TsaE